MIIQLMNPSEPKPNIPNLSGVVRLTHLGVIRAAGVDAATFLQGQLSQDVLTIANDTARLAAFCNAKGRMQASFVIFRRTPEPESQDNAGETDQFLMVCSADILAQTLKRLSQFIMRAKVKLSDASSELLLYGVTGSAIDSVASNAVETWAKTDMGRQSTVRLYPSVGVERALWCAPIGTPLPVGPDLALALWHWLDVQSGVAMLTQPIFEAFVPQMLNYESIGGVSFKKGCYPGQEVVARSQFRGTLKRRAYLLHCTPPSSGPAAVGQEVFHSSDPNQPCGLVAACAPNPTGGFDAIVSMQTSAAVGGTLTLGGPQGPELNLLALPYPLLEDI